MELIHNTNEYKKWIEELKSEVQKSQIKAAISVNHALLDLYWRIGKSISEKINLGKWGTSIVEKASKDLRNHFPNQQGFSRSNLFSMRKWYEFYVTSGLDVEKVQQLVGQIPWGHNILIVTKANTIEEAMFYINKTVENNWSRAVLAHQIDLDFYNRSGKAITNFSDTLPAPQSELALETLKDPYKFDFLTLNEKALEKDIEEQLVKHITSFLLELGGGFSFVGRQVPLKIDGEEFYIDLLFYHIKLKCYVVVELKSVKFRAEYAGKMNLYLSAVDDLMKSEGENPTIGLLLCKSKSEVIAEYALRGTTQPIGVAEYEIVKSIPADLHPELPTIEEIEKELAGVVYNKNKQK
ncbi:PDDEXK nuclease domain-containing protein [Flagellimonas onchidii]|uniref:PDDEXK nuclease domain-containing protein n=1 Tax=Flagellimonas onchidii TaxID=2562684 RepID=UPI0010A65D3D|nr:PDDEXK nuclease domain-containing protein [Allomuricauda onchidii]